MAALNCKANELAIIVRVTAPFNAGVIGRIVRTVEMLGDAEAVRNGVRVANVWHVEYRGETHRDGIDLGVPDSWLRPIRDPGDDAVDATLIYAGDPRVREVIS